AEAAACPWDDVVVGAGPAGAIATHELARWGLRVLLIDKAVFPRWKVCGCCLNGRALALLKAAGMDGLVNRLGAVPLRRMWLAARGRQACLSLPESVALSREVFDAALVTAAVSAGAAFLPATLGTLGPVTAQKRRVFLRQGGRRVEIAARLVLAADGL